MGRPINKRFFGQLATADTDNAPLNDTQENIRTTARPVGAVADGFIVNQRGTKKFTVTTANGTGVCTVVDKTSENLLVGEMILFGNVGGQTVRLSKFFNRTCRDFSNNRYTWTVVDDSTSTFIQLTAI